MQKPKRMHAIATLLGIAPTSAPESTPTPSPRPAANTTDSAPGQTLGRDFDTSPANHPDNLTVKPAEPRRLRHRVDGDVLRVWDAQHCEPQPMQTPELHARELLGWLATRFPAGLWVAAVDIEHCLYDEFLRERGWPTQPLQTVFRHLKKLTRRRRNKQGGGRRFVQVQYEIPQLEAAVIDIEIRRRA